MVYTLIDYGNDAIKCSKLTAKFLTFYGAISMVCESADHEKIWSMRCFVFVFLQQHEKIISGIAFIFRCEIVKTKRALRCGKSHHLHGLYSHLLIKHSPEPISARVLRNFKNVI